MGLFFNTCSKCRRWIPRSVSFCRYCGQGNDAGWIKCWQCGTKISPASKHCFKCGVDQKDQRALGLINGRWARQDEDIALKVDTSDLAGWLKKGLDVEQGTEAAVLQHGKLVGVTGPGRYTADSLMKRITPIIAKVPTTILLYDASDLEIVMETDGLRTSDGLEVSATYKVVVRITDAAQFIENLFKGRRSLKLPALAERISDEMRNALKAAVAGKKLSELFDSPEVRPGVEKALRATIEPVAARYGLALEQLAFIDFFSADFEAIADRKGELARAAAEGEIDLERLKLTQRLRHEMSQEKMDAFTSEKDFEDFVRQTEHELGMKDVIREDEMVRLKERFSHEREREGLLKRIEIESIGHDAEREEARAALLAGEEARATRHKGDLERALQTAENDADKQRIGNELRKEEMELDKLEAENAIAMRERTMAVQRDHERETLAMKREDEDARLRARSQASAEALLSITEGPAADRLARLAEMERKERLSPEQLFAMAAAADPEVARAYAREKGIGDFEERLRQQEDLHKGYTDRMERLMETAMQQMGRVAGAQQAFLQPGMPLAGAQPCPKCTGMVAPAMAHCPHCGYKLR
ncbi:MAG: SPFH domain-containing protein [Planctomycetota bacterium]|jgi:hypothetical protein